MRRARAHVHALVGRLTLAGRIVLVIEDHKDSLD